jgi:hypothetical protein
VPYAVVRLRHAEEHAAADDDADERRLPSRLGEEAEEQTDGDARERDRIGQEVVFEIDGEEHEKRAAENQARGQQRLRTVVPPRSGEHHRGQRFHQRIRTLMARHVGIAREAREAEDRNVLTATARGRRTGRPTGATRLISRAAGGRCRRSGNCRRWRPTRRRRP